MKYKYLYTNFGDNDFWSYYTEALEDFWSMSIPLTDVYLDKVMEEGLIDWWINDLAKSKSLVRGVNWSVEASAKYGSLHYNPVGADYFNAKFKLTTSDNFLKRADNGETFWLNLRTGEVGSA